MNKHSNGLLQRRPALNTRRLLHTYIVLARSGVCVMHKGAERSERRQAGAVQSASDRSSGISSTEHLSCV